MNGETSLVSQMMKETVIVVGTAMMAVAIPWLLVYFKILNPQISMLLFIGFCGVLYNIIWKQIKFFEPLVFIKTLFKQNNLRKKK